MQAEKTTTQSHHADSHMIHVPDGEFKTTFLLDARVKVQ